MRWSLTRRVVQCRLPLPDLVLQKLSLLARNRDAISHVRAHDVGLILVLLTGALGVESVLSLYGMSGYLSIGPGKSIGEKEREG